MSETEQQKWEKQRLARIAELDRRINKPYSEPWYDRAYVVIPLIFFVWFGIPALVGVGLWLLGYDPIIAGILWGVETIFVAAVGAGGACP